MRLGICDCDGRDWVGLDWIYIRTIRAREREDDSRGGKAATEHFDTGGNTIPRKRNERQKPTTQPNTSPDVAFLAPLLLRPTRCLRSSQQRRHDRSAALGPALCRRLLRRKHRRRAPRLPEAERRGAGRHSRWRGPRPAGPCARSVATGPRRARHQELEEARRGLGLWHDCRAGGDAGRAHHGRDCRGGRSGGAQPGAACDGAGAAVYAGGADSVAGVPVAGVERGLELPEDGQGEDAAHGAGAAGGALWRVVVCLLVDGQRGAAGGDYAAVAAASDDERWQGQGHRGRGSDEGVSGEDWRGGHLAHGAAVRLCVGVVAVAYV